MTIDFDQILALFDLAQQLTNMLIALKHVGIAWVLVLLSEGLVEDDLREVGEPIERLPELLLVF